jgi:regulator of cell morphogenesis and NO signaling
MAVPDYRGHREGSEMSTLLIDKTVGQLVAEQPARSRVFEKAGIDYCCGGKKPLGQACDEKGIKVDSLVREIEALDMVTPAPEVDWTTASLGSLADHVVKAHHDYLREALPRLTFLTEKVSNAHGDRDFRLAQVAAVFGAFREELEAHMMKEEMILFPLIARMEAEQTVANSHCGSVQNPIRVMLAEHDDAGEALAKMRSLTDGFTPPATACNTYRAMLDALAELEADMHQHVHKENHILFPRAIELETAIQ